MILTDGPYFDDLSLGDRFDTAPQMELSSGLAAVHHSILGGRLRLPFDPRFAERLTGRPGAVASPGLVWDVAIGQSTLVTQRAIANLFYRGLVFLRAPVIGDTLQTTTTIVGLRPVTPKAGRPPRGLVVMHIETLDQHDRPVLDFHRCAMLPARTERATGAVGLVDLPPSAFTTAELSAAVGDWDLSATRHVAPSFADIAAGASVGITGGDVVSSAPELARLSMNLAVVHHDRTATPSGERLVYGGHTIGLALAQASRALPSLLTVVAWHDCDHIGPVHEGDTLHSAIVVERCEPRPAGGGFVHLRSRVTATNGAGTRTDVLDWRYVGLVA